MSRHGSQIPVTLNWEQAPQTILDATRTLGAPVVIIGITGPVGAGKSTLAARLSPAVISTDSYLPDYELIPEHERDLPERADHPLLLAHLAQLRRGKTVPVPVWSFQTHRREGSADFAPQPIIVVEGIHALHGPLAAAMDLRVFVDSPGNVRWSRWEILERAGVRGWGPEKARVFFDNVAEPTFHRLAPQYIASAHYVVRNDVGLPDLPIPTAP